MLGLRRTSLISKMTLNHRLNLSREKTKTNICHAANVLKTMRERGVSFKGRKKGWCQAQSASGEMRERLFLWSFRRVTPVLSRTSIERAIAMTYSESKKEGKSKRFRLRDFHPQNILKALTSTFFFAECDTALCGEELSGVWQQEFSQKRQIWL